MKKIILILLIISFGLYADEAADKALFDAIDSRNIEGVKKAIEQGASVEVKDQEYKRTPLFSALRNYFLSKIRNKDVETDKAIVYEIFNHLKTISPNEFVKLVTAGGLRDLAEKALAMGISIDAKDSEGKTALMELLQGYPDIEDVKFLVEKGADINAAEEGTKRGSLQRSVLDFALTPGTKESLKAASYLIDKGAKVTPQHFVRAAGGHEPDLELIKKIHQKVGKENIDAVDNMGWTALRWAVLFGGGNKGVIFYLLDQGANPNAMSPSDTNSILYFLIQNYYFFEPSPVDLEMIERLLQKGAIIDPLSMALARGDYPEIYRITGDESYQKNIPQLDPVKKEQLVQLLAKYKKE